MSDNKLTYIYTQQNEKYVNPQLDSTGQFPLAEYTKSKIPQYMGNIAIESLSAPPDEETCFIDFFRGIEGYDYRTASAYSYKDQLTFIVQIRQLVFPLPFIGRIGEAIYSSLIDSYASRQLVIDPVTNMDVRAGHTIIPGHVRWVAKPGGTAGGYSVLGYSGTGKSTMLAAACTHYPSVIMLHSKEIVEFPMIPVLMVEVAPNSNLSDLFVTIGDAVDRSMNIVDHYYRDKVEHKRDLPGKMRAVCDLVELFGIGLIIIDEIQHIDFTHTKASSFESLLTLRNRTHVGLMVAGTEEAYQAMFSNLRTIRRFRQPINSTEYTSDKDYFTNLVSWLFEYQIFDPYVQITDDAVSHDIIDTLFDLTKGIIDQLVGVYEMVMYEYAIRCKDGDKPTINGAFIRETYHTHFPGMAKLLDTLSDPISQEMITSYLRTADSTVEQARAKALTEKTTESIKNATESLGFRKTQQLIDGCTNTISFLHPDFKKENISAVVRMLIKKPENYKLKPQELTDLCLQELQKKPKRKPVRKNKTIVQFDDCISEVNSNA